MPVFVLPETCLELWLTGICFWSKFSQTFQHTSEISDNIHLFFMTKQSVKNPKKPNQTNKKTQLVFADSFRFPEQFG